MSIPNNLPRNDLLYAVDEAIKQGASPKDVKIVNALFSAVQTGNMAAAKCLLDYKVDVNLPLRTGQAPLTYAMNSLNPNMVKLLLEAKAHPDHKYGIDRLTPIELTMENLYPDNILAALLNGNADPNKKSHPIQNPPLIQAVWKEKEHAGKIKLLLDSKANPDSTRIEGLALASSFPDETALHLARTPEVLSLLLDANADPRKTDAKGRTPLEAAAQSDDYQKMVCLSDASKDAHDRLLKALTAQVQPTSTSSQSASSSNQENDVVSKKRSVLPLRTSGGEIRVFEFVAEYASPNSHWHVTRREDEAKRIQSRQENLDTTQNPIKISEEKSEEVKSDDPSRAPPHPENPDEPKKNCNSNCGIM